MNVENKIINNLNLQGATANQTLLNLYVSVFTYMMPVLILYQALGFAEVLDVDFYQKVQGLSTIVGAGYLLIFRKKKSTAYAVSYIHFTLLALLTFSSIAWFVNEPSQDSTLSMFFMFFTCGIIVIRPILTVAYFLMVLIVLIVLKPSMEMLEVKLLFYFVLMAILVIIFAFWREQIVKQKNKLGISYKNLFSDSADKVFVIDLNLKILDLNKAALEHINESAQINPIGKSYFDIFRIKEKNKKELFIHELNKLNIENKTTIEAECAVAQTENYFPKEFTLRKTTFLDNEVFIITARSLKNQKEFENKLIESKENISKVLENINSFVYNISYDARGNSQVNYVSPKVKEVYGIETDEYITLIKSGRLSELFYPTDREEVILMFNDVVRTLHENRIKFRIIKNHEIRWIEERIYPQQSQEDVVSLFGIITDVTDQIDATQKLEQSEQRYRQIFERNLAGVYKIHIDGTIIDANPAFAKILGYDTVYELKKENIKNFYYYTTDRLGYLDRLKKENTLNNYISVLKRKDGKKLILNNNVTLQNDEDGNPTIVEGTLIDITDIEETSSALKLSEAKYKSLFEDSSEGIILIEFGINDIEENKIIDANKSVCKLLGYDRFDLLNKSIADIAKYKRALINLLKHHDNTNKSRIEWVFKRSDNTTFLAEINYVQIKGQESTRIQLVIQDISERKRNEDLLKESQESFKNIVDNSPLSIFIFTANQLVYSNPNGQKLHSTLLNSNSNNLFEIFPKELKYVIQDLIKEDKTHSAYTQFEIPDAGSTKQFSLNVVKTIYQGKKADMLLLQDISLQTEYQNQRLRAEIAEELNIQLKTEIENHKKTQAELQEKTNWLNALFESSKNLYILSLDKNFKIQSFNENFRLKLKADIGAECKLGDEFLAYFNISKENKAKIESKFINAFNGETLEMISHYPSRNGEVYIESFLNPIKSVDGKVSEISFISHEITEKIEIERKIKESEANNRAILLALPDIITTVNSEGVFVDFKVSDSQVLEPVIEHLKTTTFQGNSIYDVIKEKELANKFLDLTREVLATGELASFTFELKSPSGRSVYYENRFSKLNDNEVIVLARNVTDSMEYETMLVESLREKEILLKEVHHRVKNNLQVINSILNLQSSYVSDTKTLEIINESQNRIRSMSYIHESLYQTKDFSSINFSEYISNLVQNLVHSYQVFENKIDLKLEIEPVKLALDQAIPCGLILNELVSNALKYAYPDNKHGQIVIAVSEVNKTVNIGVEDFGVGLPADFSIETIDSLGLSLVHTLVDQLDGQLTYKTLGGTKFLITFEKQEI